MKVVENWEEIESNIAELERGRVATGQDFEEFRGLIKRGTCFLPYPSAHGLSFAPSRFIGYTDNKLETHADNPSRDGRITNNAINKIIGSPPEVNADLEQVYLQFCESVGVIPSKTGAFGVARKYWVTPEVYELLEIRAEREIYGNPNLSETEKKQLSKARVGQGLFREKLIDMWSGCCVTGCDYVEVLRASHIKPWRDSTNKERLDEFNGLLLSPNYDALFDKGLISFKNTGEVLISNLLSVSVREALGCSENAMVRLRPEHVKYMSWHREYIFRDAEA